MPQTRAPNATSAGAAGVARRPRQRNVAAAAIADGSRIASGTILKPSQSARYAAMMDEARKARADAATASAPTSGMATELIIRPQVRGARCDFSRARWSAKASAEREGVRGAGVRACGKVRRGVDVHRAFRARVRREESGARGFSRHALRRGPVRRPPVADAGADRRRARGGPARGDEDDAAQFRQLSALDSGARSRGLARAVVARGIPARRLTRQRARTPAADGRGRRMLGAR